MVSRRRKGPPLPTGTVTFLFTDIEGSTRLWETQRSAMQEALARHDALLRQMIERHHGHVVKTTGDGALAAFASATDALEASIAAQQALGVEPWPGPVRIRVRMALHTGPAEFRDGDYFGPTLNRAARLLALGHGGQILVSAITHELCRDYLPPDVSLSSLGEHGLKDVDRREAVFELRHAALSQVFPPLRDLVAIGETIPSIAVLPFVNRSRDEEDEYFSDGLADELLNVLAKIRGLRVAARTSSFQFRGKNEDIAVIGRKLNVATVLEGAVRKAGNRMRISVQLVKVADGYQLWSEIYDRTLEDIFAVQDDIAQSVVKKLRTTLLGAAADSDASGEVTAEVSRAAKGRSTDPEAHRLYLLAQHLYDRASREDVRKAIKYLKEALARDAQFALAWEVLSRAYSREADLSWVPIADGYGRARAAVERALALEPDLAEGHAMLGFIQMNHDWDWRGAEVSYSRALELAPGHGLVIRRAGVLATVRGRLEEAIALYRRAVEQDPLSPYAYNNLGLALYAADRFAEAAAAYREALELAPQRVATHGYLALTLLAQGLREEAIEHAMREPHEAYRLWALAIIHHALGHRGESDAAVQMLIAKYRPGAPYQVAEVYAARGEGDLAFEWLELAYAQRDGGLAEMKSDPCLRSLHTDPRWNAFMSKMGLAD